MKPRSFQFPKKICYWPGSEWCESGLWTLIMASYRSPTPTLDPGKSLQTMVHRKIGVHQEPQCLRFQNGPHEEHSLLPWDYHCHGITNAYSGEDLQFLWLLRTHAEISIGSLLAGCQNSTVFHPSYYYRFCWHLEHQTQNLSTSWTVPVSHGRMSECLL
jgi:hypothetical protein